MSLRPHYHFSVTIKTEDEGVLSCLRALSQYTQVTGNKRIPWGGTGRADWIANNKCSTFYFSRPEYRESFIREAKRLLPDQSWKKVEENDNKIRK